MLAKILRFIASFLLLPLCAAVTINFYNGIIGIKAVSGTGLVFILGALSYSVICLLFFKLDFLYVLGHELTHAVATIFSGGKVKGIKVSGNGGSVKTTSPNFFVVLSPYLIPGYTIFVGATYFLLSFFIDVTRYSGIFIFFIGFTLMFHLAYTAQSIKEKQSDLIKAGYIFSISVIYIANFTIVFAIVSILFKNVVFLKFLLGSFEKSKEFYYSFWKQLFL